MTSKQRRSYWRRWHQLLKKHEDKFLPRVQKALTDEAKRLIREAEDVGFQQAYRSLKLVNEQLLTAVNQMHKQVANEFGMMVNRELKKGQKISFFNANFLLTITEMLTRQALELLTLVEQTTKERILNILTEATTEQFTFFETAQQIEREIASPVRALAITRTESNRAANLAALEAAKLQNYVVTKEWISVIDNRTRRFREKDQYDHAELDGKVLELYESFTQQSRTKPETAVAECPLDPQAPAAFTINCRCVLGFENKRDAQGRLIPKR
jgi:hypothetical protein